MKIIEPIEKTLKSYPTFVEIMNSAGYSTKNAGDGYMLIQHKGKRYAVKITEIQTPSEKAVDDIDRLEYLV